MDSREYCSNLENRLTEYKAKMYDCRRELDNKKDMDQLNTEIVSHLQDVDHIIEELEDTVQSLKRDCPQDFSAVRDEVEGKTAELESTFEDIMLTISKEAPYNA
ncbi:MAG TPA: hypothetical protein PKJ77_07610 [Thermodesulfobacteriota bacterium]|nr:hypothetical protein [Deltaproteobacteria bacterium]HNR12327.1 hypothetical protein [Thermodesulfobacteriota bacterium]HNU71288.1 hypothetical protein [Thermodesulfobacteriota bacterium]HOC39127.1 hypothetical protein [Thermodesulfobacteriota bacterium]